MYICHIIYMVQVYKVQSSEYTCYCRAILYIHIREIIYIYVYYVYMETLK